MFEYQLVGMWKWEILAFERRVSTNIQEVFVCKCVFFANYPTRLVLFIMQSDKRSFSRENRYLPDALFAIYKTFNLIIHLKTKKRLSVFKDNFIIICTLLSGGFYAKMSQFVWEIWLCHATSHKNYKIVDMGEDFIVYWGFWGIFLHSKWKDSIVFTDPLDNFIKVVSFLRRSNLLQHWLKFSQGKP